MSFLYPSYLWALFALSIPIIIHLFYFRRYKKVYFSDIRFLKNIKEERSNIERIKHFLILCSRLLVLAFLIFAFARPMLKEKEDATSGIQQNSIYIDNSLSMSLGDGNENSLNKAKSFALDIVQNSSELGQYLVLTNDLSEGSNRWMTKDQAIQEIDGINLTNKTKTFGEVNEFRKSFYKDINEKGRVFWISDCQENVMSNFEDTTALHYLWPVVNRSPLNVFVDSCWLLNPVHTIGQIHKLGISIGNASEDIERDIRVSLDINNVTKTVKNISLQSGTSVVDTIQFTLSSPGMKNIKLSIEDNNVIFDNDMYGSFNVDSSKSILEITSDQVTSYISSVYNSSPYTKYSKQNYKKLRYSEFQSKDLIVLNEIPTLSEGLQTSLLNYIENGGNLYVIPSINMNKASYNSFLKKCEAAKFEELVNQEIQISKFNLEENLLKDVIEFLPENALYPKINSYYKLSMSSRTRYSEVLKTSNNNVVLSQFPFKNGQIFLQSFPLSKENASFSRHYIFAPLLFNMAFEKDLTEPLYFTIGKNLNMSVDVNRAGKDEVLAIRSDGIEFLPRQQSLGDRISINASNENLHQGTYGIYQGDKLLKWFSANLDREESKLNFIGVDSLKTGFKTFNLMINSKDEAISSYKVFEKGRQLWKLCLILALIFIGVEAILLRLFT